MVAAVGRERWANGGPVVYCASYVSAAVVIDREKVATLLDWDAHPNCVNDIDVTDDVIDEVHGYICDWFVRRWPDRVYWKTGNIILMRKED